MTETFYTNQNIPDNINNQNYVFSQKANSLKPNKNIPKVSLQVGNKNVKNFTIEEVPQKEEDIDHLQKFHLERGFQINKNRINSLNTNKIPHSSFSKSFQNENNINKGVSGKIPHPRKTHGFIPVDKNKLPFGMISHKRNASGERPTQVKQFHSKYNSASENKYHFLHRIAGNQKFGIENFSSNNNPKANYGPVDSIKNVKRQSNNKPIYNMDNYINNQTKKFDERENRFLYNKNSNFDYNTVNGNKLQNNVQLVKIRQNNNSNAINYYNLKNSASLNNINSHNYQNVNNNFSVNNDVNPVNQRLTTVGFEYLNNNTNKNVSPLLRAYTPKQTTMQTYNNQLKINQPKNKNTVEKKEPEIAIVTKISSSNDNKFMNNNLNNFAQKQNIGQTTNQVNKIPYNYISNNLGGQIIGNNLPPQGNLNQMRNNMNNNYLTQQQINQLLNQNSNPFINPHGNVYIPSTLTIIPSQPKLTSNYNTNTILTPQNFNKQNINHLLNQKQNNINNFNTFNHQESERATIINDKINNNVVNVNTNKQITNKNNDINLTNNDFTGIGLVKNYNGVSRPGKDGSGKTKTNQDSFVIKPKINNIKDFNIFGVLDGHGPDGHFVSEFISELIPSQIINHPEIKNLKNIEAIYQKLKENNYKIINQSFITSDKQLQNMEFDVSESGCTCCLVIQLGNHIICANTGDSRAILAYDQANSINKKDLNYLDIVPLSVDFKPELPEETRRIIMSGGEVEQMKDEYGEGLGPYRVWAKGKDYPGLAMSRSIGDLKGKSIGVIPDPGILEYNINSSTKYIVACSDGVWEFLNNQTVMNIGKKFYLENNASAYCHELISKSFNEWKKNDSIVDDITAIVVFF